jgi:5,10-methenyltetrahydrofolate synthetase
MLLKQRLRDIYKKEKIENKIIIKPKINFIKKNAIVGGYTPFDNREITLIMNCAVIIPEIISQTEMIYKYNDKIITPKIIFVPCRALDREGSRVGSGKGYFDRYFSNTNQDIIKIGVVRKRFLYDETIERQKHDIKMNYILTEEEFLKI